MALLLDLANIAGGFLLAIPLLRRLPRIGDDLARVTERSVPFAWIVGIVALATAGAYLLIHLLDGPRVFHFEIVGIGVGVALLWDRLTGRKPPERDNQAAPTGATLLLAVFGIIAILVGLQGLFTPD